ncbi:hypothetical protein C0992_003394 [Termitomyces sp. T32_za158]|nr:hypothetical protein C0992_003394 [Termitomyces sp. T32_za158]
MILRHVLTRRDALLMILGAAVWHLWHILDSATPALYLPTRFPFDADANANATHANTNTNTSDAPHVHSCAGTIQPLLADPPAPAREVSIPIPAADPDETPTPIHPPPAPALPHTSIIAHAPGWTIFRDLYMSNGTLYILAEEEEEEEEEGKDAGGRAGWPAMRMMMSTGLPASTTPENIAAREPTARDMDFITPREAVERWDANRVRVIEGNTFLFNDPAQFLTHYYHFVAELFFGAWAFWSGAWARPAAPSPPGIARVIFPHADARGWRDAPGFNAYFLRGAFPSLPVEVLDDWADRVGAHGREHAWRFPVVLVADRSAAFRGKVCGRTQRTAAEAVEYMSAHAGAHEYVGTGAGAGAGEWWHPLRAAVWDYAGVDVDVDAGAEEKIVITYVSRQRGGRRKLREADHAGLVEALEGLVRRRGSGWEFVVMEAERMSKDAQVAAAARTTVGVGGWCVKILLGVHGNGLTHLVFMKPTRASAVVEIFYQGGFAYDYQWTARALGMDHYTVWNDTYMTHPNEPGVNYPEGFQGTEIAVDGASVARLVEAHVDKRAV